MANMIIMTLLSNNVRTRQFEIGLCHQSLENDRSGSNSCHRAHRVGSSSHGFGWPSRFESRYRRPFAALGPKRRRRHQGLARSFRRYPTTFTSYRKEAERLLLWSVIELGNPMPSLTHEDLLIYQRFLVDPQPAERWVMKAGQKWSRFEPDWRLVAGPLAPTSQRQAIVILNTLFSWLVNAGYLAGNHYLFRDSGSAGPNRALRDSSMTSSGRKLKRVLSRCRKKQIENGSITFG